MCFFGGPVLLISTAVLFGGFVSGGLVSIVVNGVEVGRQLPPSKEDDILVGSLHYSCGIALNDSMPVYREHCWARGLNCTGFPYETCFVGPLNSSEPVEVFCGKLAHECVDRAIARYNGFIRLFTGVGPPTVKPDVKASKKEESHHCSATAAPLAEAPPASDGGNTGEQYCGRTSNPVPTEQNTKRLPWEVEIVKWAGWGHVKHACRGVLVATNVVLTTVDCVYKFVESCFPSRYDHLFVRVGPNCTDIEVDEIEVHPKSMASATWRREHGVQSWNLALLFLKNATNDSRIAKGAVSPICLPEKDDSASTDKCVISSDQWEPDPLLLQPAESYHINVTAVAADNCRYEQFAVGQFKNTHCLEVQRSRYDERDYDAYDDYGPLCYFVNGAAHQCQTNDGGKWTVHGMHGISLMGPEMNDCMDRKNYYPFISVSGAVPWIKRELGARGITVPFHPADKLKKKLEAEP